MKILTLCLIFLASCVAIKGYKQDALVEEITEEVIKSNTGLDVDLSPQSKE